MERDTAARRVSALQDEVRQLQEAIASHTVVDQAIGVVIVLGGLTPDGGWAVLREVSQHTNTKLRLIAEQVVSWASGGWLSDDTRHALDAALARAAADGTDGGRNVRIRVRPADGASGPD